MFKMGIYSFVYITSALIMAFCEWYHFFVLYNQWHSSTFVCKQNGGADRCHRPSRPSVTPIFIFPTRILGRSLHHSPLLKPIHRHIDWLVGILVEDDAIVARLHMLRAMPGPVDPKTLANDESAVSSSDVRCSPVPTVDSATQEPTTDAESLRATLGDDRQRDGPGQ